MAVASGQKKVYPRRNNYRYEEKMWHWDQGRLEYFQFDNLRKISKILTEYDFKHIERDLLQKKTGLSFAAPPTHSPWRNYSRILKLMLLTYELPSNIAVPTPICRLLATPGMVTCDDYLHFIISSSTEPSPALSGWTSNTRHRYPLLFVLKYVLAKFYITSINYSSLDEIIYAYDIFDNFDGSEGQDDFILIINQMIDHINDNRINLLHSELYRQSRESILVLAQISYLHIQNRNIFVSLSREDALSIFNELEPFSNNPVEDRNKEILRRAEMFQGGSIYNDFDYSNTIINNELESGFIEGGRIKKTHIAIERNSGIRREFFIRNPTTVCDVCGIDTKLSYTWTNKIIDLHHLLPLASGTRVESSGTTFLDITPVCPTCHRAIHRFYDVWLKQNNKNDFMDRDEAKQVYNQMKNLFPGIIYANS